MKKKQVYVPVRGAEVDMETVTRLANTAAVRRNGTYALFAESKDRGDGVVEYIFDVVEG